MSAYCFEKITNILTDLDDNRKAQLDAYLGTAPLWLIDAISVEEIGKDTIFVREGEPVDTIFFVAKGIIKATDYRVYGIPFDFMLFSKVYAFGGMEIIMEHENYLTTLQTVSQCTVLKVPRGLYEKWLKNDFNALKYEAKMVGEYLLEQARSSRAFVFLQGFYRVAFLLVKHYEKYAENEVLCMNGDRQRLADYTGLSVKTITRSIQKFRAESLITQKGKIIVIDNHQYQRLKELVSRVLIEE